MALIAMEPQVPDTGKYGIGDAAKLLGVSRRTLLNHTKDCRIRCGHAKHSGRKFYYGVEIKRFWRVSI